MPSLKHRRLSAQDVVLTRSLTCQLQLKCAWAGCCGSLHAVRPARIDGRDNPIAVGAGALSWSQTAGRGLGLMFSLWISQRRSTALAPPRQSLKTSSVRRLGPARSHVVSRWMKLPWWNLACPDLVSPTIQPCDGLFSRASTFAAYLNHSQPICRSADPQAAHRSGRSRCVASRWAIPRSHRGPWNHTGGRVCRRRLIEAEPLAEGGTQEAGR